ncbi:hypothetical protein [Saccharicrinis aurantiacus]|uniref:hypothetical protein n=1 Tax=Saccharicrinis aurantiacus TaxID=1849719 RepID=UPI00094F5109|nr:hypothetical protein [Saccharicrinis aurantiacus]
MKKLVSKLMLATFCVLMLAGGSAFAQDHDAVTDSLSIDDMAPVLYDESAYDESAYDDEEEGSSNGVVIGIVIAVVAIGGIAVVAKKKKK